MKTPTIAFLFVMALTACTTTPPEETPGPAGPAHPKFAEMSESTAHQRTQKLQEMKTRRLHVFEGAKRRSVDGGQ